MIPVAAEVALVVAEDAETEVEAEVEAEVVEAEVEVLVTPHLLRRFDRVEEEGGEETVFSTKPRCSNNWKRFYANNRRPRVVALRASRPPTRLRLPIKTDNDLPSRNSTSVRN